MSNKRYTKEDVETHSAGYYAPYYPAVNVKAYNYPHCWKVADYLDIPEDKAEELLSMIFEQSQEIFWEDVKPLANEIFSDYRVQIYSAGRCGGWVIVQGLPEIESWDAVILAKWRKFERACEQMRDSLCSWEWVKIEVDFYASEFANELEEVEA